MDKTKLEEIYDLIEKKSFNKANKILLHFRKENNKPHVNYLIGFIHHINISHSSFSISDDKFVGSKSDAIKYLGYAIESDQPVEDAFWRLADLEKNKDHAVRILKKGLEYFPVSESIYKSLLLRSNPSDIVHIAKEIENKDINSNPIFFELFELSFNQREFDTAIHYVEKIKGENNSEKQLISLIKAYCLLELKKIKSSKKIFEDLVKEDLNHKLNYAQYIGLLSCYLEKNIQSSLKIIQQLPNTFDESYIYNHRYLRFSFANYKDDIFAKYVSRLKLKKEYKEAYAKIRGIIALEQCSYENVTKKTIQELKFARNNLTDNKSYNTALVDALIMLDQYADAFKQEIKNFNEYPNYKTQIFSLNSVPEKELQIIIENFEKELSNTHPWEQTKWIQILEFVAPILHNKKDYKRLTQLCSSFEEKELLRSNILFEIAYSHEKRTNYDKAKLFYEKMWENEPHNKFRSAI